MKYEIIFKNGKIKNIVSKDVNKVKNYITESFNKIKSYKRLDEDIDYILDLYKSDEHAPDKNGDYWGYITIDYHTDIITIPFNCSTNKVSFDNDQPWKFIKRESKKWDPEIIELLKKNSNKLNNFLKSGKISDKIKIKE